MRRKNLSEAGRHASGEASREDDLSKISALEHLFKTARFGTKAAVGLVPIPGLSSIAAELFDLVVSDPAAKRRDRFLTSLADRLAALEADAVIKLESLLDDENIAAVMYRSAQAAMRSSGERKLVALRNAAIRGIVGSTPEKSSQAQTVIGFLDRMTEHHVIRLAWEAKAEVFYTMGEVMDPANEIARRSFFYGQPVTDSPEALIKPVCLRSWPGGGIYVESDQAMAFELALADLVAMGLMTPVLVEEEYLEGREVRRRLTPRVHGYRISEMGRYVDAMIKDL